MSVTSCIRLLLTACLVLAWTAGPAEGAAPEFSGFIKSLNLYGDSAPGGLTPHFKISSNRIRLDCRWAIIPKLQFEASLDHQFLYTDPEGITPLADDGFNRHIDLDKTWQHSDKWASRLQFDRLALRWQEERFDAIIGRQAIGYGRILIFSPLDVIAPFAPDEIDNEVRIGVDALRVTGHYGLDGQLGGTFVWGDRDRDCSYLATWSDNRAGVDLLAIGGKLRDRPMIGLGLAGSLGELGLKGEVAFYDGKRTDRADGDLHDTFTIGALEAWYRFDFGLTLVGEYFYNGPGVGHPEDYFKVFNSAPVREGLTYLFGRHYLMFAPAYELHALADLQGIIIWNLEDDSYLARPTLELSLSDNLALDLYWTWNSGDNPDQVANSSVFIPHSEFGLRGDSGGFFLKFFF